MRAAVVWNPSKTDREDLEQALSGAGDAELSWWETSEDDPGQQVTVRAVRESSPDLVIVAGGDGTVRAAAETLAELDDAPELAILPLGTGNLLARNLDVPLQLAQAAQRALTGTARDVDFAWVDAETSEGRERHGFAVMVGFGIDANMIAETNDDLKASAGWLAYVESLGRAVSGSDLVHSSVALDGKEQEVDAHTIMVANCGMVQGGITLLPDAAADDGTLDILMLSADGVGGWLDTMKTMLWDNGLARIIPGVGADRHDDAVSGETALYEQAKHVRVTLPDPRPFQIDGEEVGDVREFTIEVQPAALRIR